MFVEPIYYKSPDFCATQPIGCELRLRPTLVVEELFGNTVPRGHRGDSASPVRLALALGAQGIELFYEDQARAFDPLAWAPSAPAGAWGQDGIWLRGAGGAAAQHCRELCVRRQLKPALAATGIAILRAADLPCLVPPHR
jgi:anti-sigma regulatory factor (Ser/Thr protein kinase)